MQERLLRCCRDIPAPLDASHPSGMGGQSAEAGHPLRGVGSRRTTARRETGSPVGSVRNPSARDLPTSRRGRAGRHRTAARRSRRPARYHRGCRDLRDATLARPGRAARLDEVRRGRRHLRRRSRPCIPQAHVTASIIRRVPRRASSVPSRMHVALPQWSASPPGGATPRSLPTIPRDQ